MINDNESVYSMKSDATHVSTVTVTTNQLGITVSIALKYIIKCNRAKQHSYY
jgi:hypothetical protein